MVSAKTQRDPDEANPGWVAFVGWVTLKGGKTSGEPSQACMHASEVIVGETLKRGESLREAKRIGRPTRSPKP
jgi:hypothetical protein